MSDKNMNSAPVVADTSSSEIRSKTDVDPPLPRVDIDNQPQELPDSWNLVDRMLCWTTIGESILEHFWEDMRENGWEGGNARLRNTVTEITTVLCVYCDLPSFCHVD